MSVPRFVDPRERAIWVKAQLELNFSNLTKLAKEAGVSRQAVASALVRPAAKLEGVIANALGVTPQELFPERFDDLGQRRHRSKNDSSIRCGRNVNSGIGA